MKKLDIEELALDIKKATDDYITEIMKDRLDGKLTEWFDEALTRKELEFFSRVFEPSEMFVEAALEEQERILANIGGDPHVIGRLVMEKYSMDIEDVRVAPLLFLNKVRVSVQEYVDGLPSDISIATRPALILRIQDYMVEWRIWGYFGRLVCE
jgi:hypothetical protein